ncbi:MAG: SHOCT-like domain-containing protein [Anaerolineales bacterium]
MVSTDERLKILQMLEEGKITAEEASQLIRALGKQGRKRRPVPTPQSEPRWLRVRVTEPDKDRASVNVNLPLNMVNVGLKMGARFIPEFEGLDLEELGEALRAGLTGKIVDVVDEEDGSHVEVYIE